MALIKNTLRTTLPVCLFLLVLPAVSVEPAQETAPRPKLLQRFQALQEKGVNCAAAPEDCDEYMYVVESLGYHDLLAECLETRITHNDEGAADDPELWRSLGKAWMHCGPQSAQKAFDAFQQALTLQDKDVETRALLAELLYREGLYEQARVAYESVLELEPAHVRARLGKAGLLVRDGNIAEASALIDAVGAAAQPYDVLLRLMVRSALHTFEKRRGWFDDTAENHHAYARLLYQAARITDALMAARRAAELAPDDHTIWNFIGAMHLQLGTRDQAVKAYNNSLEINPDQPQIKASLNQLSTQ